MGSELRSLRYGYNDYPNFLAGTIATRVWEDLRIAASNSSYTEDEINRFIKGHPEFKSLPGAERLNKFKYDRINDLVGTTIPYYMGGDGYSKVLSICSNEKRQRLYDLLELTRKFLHVSHVDVLPTERYIGKNISVLGQR